MNIILKTLCYNEPSYGNTPWYAGDIATMEWKADAKNRVYNFTYDGFSRLTRADQAGSHEAHVQQDIAVYAACKVTNALLDAVVLVVGIDGGIVPGLRYEVHCGCKGTAFPRHSCVLQNGFTNSKPRK